MAFPNIKTSNEVRKKMEDSDEQLNGLEDNLKKLSNTIGNCADKLEKGGKKIKVLNKKLEELIAHPEKNNVTKSIDIASKEDIKRAQKILKSFINGDLKTKITDIDS